MTNLPRYYQDPETGQLEEVRPQSGAGPANPEWRTPKEGECIGLRGGFTRPVERCIWREGAEHWEIVLDLVMVEFMTKSAERAGAAFHIVGRKS